MKQLCLILLLFSFIYADEFDMFEEIDKEQSSFEDETSFLDVDLKLNYQYNESSDDEKVLFVNLKKDTKYFFVDMRLVADDKTQRILTKELYIKDEFLKHNNYKLGRMNIKEGYAKGFNPTDYFRGNPSLTLSNDPKERKDNRLGSVALSYTAFLDDFVFRALYSPKITTKEDTLLSDNKYFGLRLDKTNAQNRESLYLSYSGIGSLSSSVILHYNNDGLNLGFNLSYIYSDFIFYLESSSKNKEEFVNQTTVGLTHTSDYGIVTSLEYIYNGEQDDELLFLNSRASDVLVDLDINLIVWFNPQDESSMTQLGFEYALSDSIQTDIALSNYMGDERSQYGSALNDFEVLIEAKYFF